MDNGLSPPSLTFPLQLQSYSPGKEQPGKISQEGGPTAHPHWPQPHPPPLRFDVTGMGAVSLLLEGCLFWGVTCVRNIQIQFYAHFYIIKRIVSKTLVWTFESSNLYEKQESHPDKSPGCNPLSCLGVNPPPGQDLGQDQWQD